jgi:hypothetical protein
MEWYRQVRGGLWLRALSVTLLVAGMAYGCGDDEGPQLASGPTGAAQSCGNNRSEGSEVCDGTDLDGATCATEAPSTPYGSLACNAGCTAFVTTGCAGRFVDNGDGTVTDNQTGLMWEKKTGASGLHDVNGTYTWSTGSPYYNPDGTAFFTFLVALDGVSSDGRTITGCFANHCDWRLPTIVELQGIVDGSATGCGSGSPCIDPVFGPTQAYFYWSATNGAGSPNLAWGVDFDGGYVIYGNKSYRFHVRAVRGGL